MKKNTYYTAIVEYKDSPTEAKRRQDYQDEKIEIAEEIQRLSAEGNDLLKGVSAGDAFVGAYRGADRVKAIQQEIHILTLKLNGKQMPVFDDEFVAICEELDTVSEALEEAEARYEEAIKECENSRGKVPYDMYMQTSEEAYNLSQKIVELKEQKKELTFAKNNYVRKTDSLLQQYEIQKKAEVRQYTKDTLQGLIDHLRTAHTEMQSAEEITFARKGEKPTKLPIIFHGDVLSGVIARLEEILKMVERG